MLATIGRGRKNKVYPGRCAGDRGSRQQRPTMRRPHAACGCHTSAPLTSVILIMASVARPLMPTSPVKCDVTGLGKIFTVLKVAVLPVASARNDTTP